MNHPNTRRHMEFCRFFIALLFLICEKLFAQPSREFPMDTVFDRFGNRYAVNSLQVEAHLGNGENTRSAPFVSCTSGMFEVYFAPGSNMESLTNPVHAMRRQTICEVLNNISGLLGYNAAYPANARVQLLVEDISNFTGAIPPSMSGILGIASAYYVVPLMPASANPGVAENLIEKTIRTGSNAWLNTVAPLSAISGQTLLHGVMAFNFANSNINWNADISVLPGSQQMDLYSIALHEITHALGFSSLISSLGISVFGPANNYFSRYDTYLRKQTGSVLQPLLTATAGCSPDYALNFSGSSSVLSPACTFSYQTDQTACASAIIYKGSSYNVPVYTPACFEGGSSLSHFEDMCYPVANPANNNQYFAMSNAAASISKRYLKPAERSVLCDLGYTVSSTYTSNAVGATFAYSSAVCSPNQIWGINDGIQNNSFVFTSAGGPLSIPVQSVIANDYQGTFPVTGITCVESVYGNGTASLSGSNIIFTPNQNISGVILIRYIPVNANGDKGNITYVFGFIYPSYCGSVNICDMVQNGTFENHVGCGSMPVGSATMASCWLINSLNPDIFVRGCVSGTIPANPGTNTYSSTPVMDTYNGAPNNAMMGFGAYDDALSESAANYLGAPVKNGQVYTLSFWAYQFSGVKYDPAATTPAGDLYPQNYNLQGVNAVLSFCTDSNYIPGTTIVNYPVGQLTVLQSVTLASVFNSWRYYSVTFTATAITEGQWLFIGTDKNKTKLNCIQMNASNVLFYTLVDDVSLKPAAQTAQLNMPTRICVGESLTNLHQYVNSPAGFFSGQGISTSTVAGPGGPLVQYHFNAAQTMTAGLYTINYTYTNQVNCVHTIVRQITVGNISNNSIISYSPPASCTGPGTISVSSPPGTYSYTWLPTGGNNSTFTVMLSQPVTYSVLGMGTGTCATSATRIIEPVTAYGDITCSQPSVCPGGTVRLSAVGNFTSLAWLPTGALANPLTVSNLSATTIYSAFITSAAGCTAMVTQSVYIAPTRPVNLVQSSYTICSGQQVTITASGGVSYSWNISPSSNSVITVNPASTLIYTVWAYDANNCASAASGTITIRRQTLQSSSSLSICKGESATLTAQPGANVYHWMPANVYAPSATVAPQISTMYTVSGTYFSTTGHCVLSNTVMVNVDQCVAIPESDRQVISVYPNPSDGSVEIHSAGQREVNIRLWSEMGLLLREERLSAENSYRIQLNGLPAGILVLEGSGRYYKLVVQK